MMDSITAGMRQSFTEQYSGDLFIFAPVKDESEISVFGNFAGEAVAPLDQLAEFETELAQIDNVKLISKMTVGMGRIETAMGEHSISSFWGVDPTVWNDSFAQHLIWHKGGLWRDYESAIALTKSVADTLSEDQDEAVTVGDKILMTVMGDNGIKIREMTVSGIFEFKTITSPQQENMSLIDLRTSQSLLSLDLQNDEVVELTEAESTVLGDVGDESLFGESALFSDNEDSFIAVANKVSFDQLNEELSATLKRDKTVVKNFIPQYQFAVVVLDNPSEVTKTQIEIQQWSGNNGLNWRIGDWENAAGFIGSMASAIKTVLNALVLIIAFVSTLIIMNTLVISVTERMQEIGTMRSIGAQKNFVRKMILAETLMLALVSVIVGVVLSGVVLFVVNITGIPASNEFMMIIFGGHALYPTMSISAIGQAAALMTVGALIACLYPLAIALKVSPLKAMQG